MSFSSKTAEKATTSVAKSNASVVQTKLTVNEPRDGFEQEADTVTERVMQRKESENSVKQQNHNQQQTSIQSTTLTPIHTAISDTTNSIQSKPIQAKLTVNEPSDTYEQEADEVAERVMQTRTPSVSNPPIPLTISNLQRKESNIGGKLTAPALVSEVLSSSGQSLDKGSQDFMGNRIGHDFNHVQIHTDNKAAESAQSINARAYTLGNHIVFGKGEYQPHTEGGKKLLAHELTHTIQQSGIVRRKLNDGKKSATICNDVAMIPVEVIKPSSVETDIPDNTKKTKNKKQIAKVKGQEAKGDDKKQPTEAQIGSEKTTSLSDDISSKDIKKAKAVSDPSADAAFKDLAKDTKRAKKSQNEHDKSQNIAQEAELAAENPKDKNAQVGDANKVLATDESLDKVPSFSKETFKENVKKLIEKGLPKDEKANNDYKVETLISETSQEAVKTEKPRTDVLSSIESANTPSSNNTGLIYDKGEIIPAQAENLGRRALIGEAERAIPKPVPDEDIMLDEAHNADSLDKAMEDDKLKEFGTQLTNEQLSDSNEPEFQAALATKQESQKELCKVPSVNRAVESNAQIAESEKAQKELDKVMGSKFGKRKESFGKIDEGKDAARQKDEEILAAYYAKIADIFKVSKEAVDKKLENLDSCVSCIFDEAMTKANDQFTKNVKARLDDYYGVGVFNLSEEDDDEWERETKKGLSAQIAWLKKMKGLTQDASMIAKLDAKIKLLEIQGSGIETIPEKIFREEKTTFLKTLDTALEEIATFLEKTFKEATEIIKQGKEDIVCASQCLPVHLQREAAERTADFTNQFDDLNEVLSEKQKSIEESLARDYVKNVKELKKTFDAIREESAKSWWQRAYDAIKKIAMIVYDLGKLLVKVLTKAANVIGDIVAHPLQFVGNLIRGIGLGFSNFVDNIGTHLENIIFKLILGTAPPSVKMPEKWDAKGIFSFALDLLGLSKANIREKAVAKFGEGIVSGLESTFELFILFKNEGFSGLWEYVKEKIGDLKDMVIEQVKSFLTESIVKAAIKFLLSALTPASGFIKACETIINAATFFIEKLTNLLQLLDGILDSFIDIAKGNIENAAKKVEGALADILLIGIKFLAALVGIQFDKITEKISKIFNAIRNPVDRAINWLLDKAESFAKKTGLIDLVKKGKDKLEKGKDWAKEKGKAAGEKVLNFFGVKSTFKDEKGKIHTVAFEEIGGQIVLIVRSTPKSIEEFIEFYENTYKKGNKNKTKAKHIEDIKNTLIPEMKRHIKKDDKEKLLDVKIRISHKLGLLMSKNEKVGNSIESYKLEGMVGRYAKTADSTHDQLEGDHQPQTALLIWSKKYLKKSLIDQWIGGGHGDNAYTILLHKRRHALGATHSTFEKPDETAIEAETDLIKKGKKVVAILKKALKHDADEILKVYRKQSTDEDTWGDIWYDTELETDEEKKDLISKIRENVKAGEASIQQQPLDSLIE